MKHFLKVGGTTRYAWGSTDSTTGTGFSQHGLTSRVDPITIVHEGYQGGKSVRLSGVIWMEDVVEKLAEKHDVRQHEVRETLTGQPFSDGLRRDIGFGIRTILPTTGIKPNPLTLPLS